MIVDSVRTGLTKSFRGQFNQTRPDEMVAHLIKALLKRNASLDKKQIEDVIVGCGFPEGVQGNVMGRACALLAGLPESTGGMSINRYCSSGLQSIAIAAEHIESGFADCIIAGGVESISMVQNTINTKGLYNTQLAKKFPGLYHTMIQTAETVADRYNITRKEMDEYAFQSQMRMAKAQKEGRFKDEIIPMEVMMKVVDKATGDASESKVTVDRDMCNRPETKLEDLEKLKPVFKADGYITAGNASQLADGASMTLVMSETLALELGLEPLAYFRGFVSAGCKPDEMGIGPIYAIPKLLEKAGLKMGDIDIIELNEAFASQVVYIQKHLGIENDKFNIYGGSIAIGHPYGMTGSRQVGQVARALQDFKAQYGIITMCIGGGQGACGLLEAYKSG